MQSDSVASYYAALDAVDAGIYGGQDGDDADPTGLKKSVESLIAAVTPAAEAAAALSLRYPDARTVVEPLPPARPEE